ncbi:thioesterase family protein [bacterium]|nr:thioesterase family protein [bacterium]
MTKKTNIQKGHDGPYKTPIILSEKRVLKDWIDYNGHMNVAFYTLAFDNSLDEFLENTLGIGETHASHNQQGPFVLQAHYHYLNEMSLDEKFNVRLLVVDCDEKRMHLCLDIFSVKQKKIIAVSETVLINVNLVIRRTEKYPTWALKRLVDLKNTHANINFPSVLGKSIGLKK